MRQLQCSFCGWKGELDPDGTLYFGPGGTLSCPNCTEKRINGPGIEFSFGNVDVVDVPPFKGWKINQSRRQKLIHYYENDKAICGAKTSGDEYLIKAHYLDGYSKEYFIQLHKKWCPKCEAKLAINANHCVEKAEE